ncbi:MAG TPA: ATP-binding protein, partial [Steroidobacteraceae bacterium]|nr:ATP-binding protein [Steroidobacteraceae bacterium]
SSLHRTNRMLAAEIKERERAEAALSRLNLELDQRVKERTTELELANKELESFSYSVSHDLRAPLRAICGFAKILRADCSASIGEDGRQCLDKIIAAGAHMGRLIEDLLLYARTGRAAERTVAVPLAPLMATLTAEFGERIAAAGARIEISKPLATPLGDPTLVGQILNNLVDNALTYRCPRGTPEIRIVAKQAGKDVVIQVADNGIGIEPEYHEKIFQAFQRLHGKDEYPGTGLGLAIVAKAVRLMQGDVTVESAPGRGSTFAVRLPAAGGDSA